MNDSNDSGDERWKSAAEEAPEYDEDADAEIAQPEAIKKSETANSRFTQPTSRQLKAFAAGDPIAIDEVARLLLPQLHDWALSQFDNLPPDEVQSEVNRVLAGVCVKSSRYDPERALLTTYIINILIKRLAGLSKGKKREQPLQSLELVGSENAAQPLYKSSKQADVDVLMTRSELFAMAQATLPEPQRSFLELMRQGEKSHDAYRSVLERYGTVSNSAHAVKNIKAQVERALRKLANERGLSRSDLVEE